MRGFNRSLAVKLLLAGLLALAAAMTVSAQQEEPSSSQSSAQSHSQSTATTPLPDDQATPKLANQHEDVSVRPQDEDISSLSFDKHPTNLATGKALTTTRSPFRWGSLSVLSADILQVFDSNYLFLKDNPVAVHAGALRALVVYAVKTGRSNFSL